MSRIKTFNSTGTAPDGRLYAGDLNAIEDHYADASNFSQTVDVGTVRVGDSSLQLFKYGTGELRATGALRTDGIFRGLGGLIAGAFTTAQRDAIAPGSRPYGLAVLNPTTNRYEYNSGTDAAPNWKPFGSEPLVGSNISLFPNPSNGQIASISVGDDWILLTYSSALGRWVSQPLISTIGAAANAGSLLMNGGGASVSGQGACGIILPNFQAIYQAGLRVQVQLVARNAIPLLQSGSYNGNYSLYVGIYQHAQGGAEAGIGTSPQLVAFGDGENGVYRETGWVSIGTNPPSTIGAAAWVILSVPGPQNSYLDMVQFKLRFTS